MNFLKDYKDHISSIGIIFGIFVFFYGVFFTEIPEKIKEELNAEIVGLKNEIIDLNKSKKEKEIENLKLEILIEKKNNEIKSKNNKIEVVKKEKENIENSLTKIEDEKYNEVLKNYINFLFKELKKQKENVNALYFYKETLDFVKDYRNQHVDGVDTGVLERINTKNNVYIKNGSEIVGIVQNSVNDLIKKRNDYMSNCLGNYSKEVKEECEGDVEIKYIINYDLTVDFLIDNRNNISFIDFIKDSFYKYRNLENGKEMDEIHLSIIKNFTAEMLSTRILDTRNLEKENVKGVIERGEILIKNIEKVEAALSKMQVSLKK